MADGSIYEWQIADPTFGGAGTTGWDLIKGSTITFPASGTSTLKITAAGLTQAITSDMSFDIAIATTSVLNYGNITFDYDNATKWAGSTPSFTYANKTLTLTGLMYTTGTTSCIWNSDSGGSWNTGTNWTGGEPNAMDAVAELGIATSAAVTVDSYDVTVGSIKFTDTNLYTVSGAKKITMQTGAGNALIEVQKSVTQTLTAPLVIASNTDINGPGALVAGNISTNTGTTLNVNTNVAAGAISGTGSTSVADGKSLTADSIVQGTLTIGAGGSVTIRETTVAGSASPVPEPGTWALIGIGLLSLLAFRRRR